VFKAERKQLVGEGQGEKKKKNYRGPGGEQNERGLENGAPPMGPLQGGSKGSPMQGEKNMWGGSEFNYKKKKDLCHQSSRLRKGGGARETRGRKKKKNKGRGVRIITWQHYEGRPYFS